MTTWKKWAVRTIVTLVVIGGVLFGLFVLALSGFSNDMCTVNIFNHVVSPDGKKQAVLYEIDCGAATGFNRRVSITASDIDLKQKKPTLGKSFFASAGEPRVEIAWSTSNRLNVQYSEWAKVFRIEPKSKGVTIQYKKLR